MPNKYLVLGGTGSLGTEFTKHILKKDTESVRVFSRNEFAQVEMQRELTDPRLRFLIGDIRDKDRLHRAMKDIDVVVHCAALKHVPVCEYNPIEAVKTNVDGSVNIIDEAIDAHIKKVIFISSDKAVLPYNLYGATKLVSEKLFVHANIYGKTRFSCIRFGNFWGSRGSVIPLWEKQRLTGEITITDPLMERYWITLDEASEFIISCLDLMNGGEIFIPIMSSYTMDTVAKMIAPECKQKIIGKRFSEKDIEVLYNAEEESRLYRRDDCYIIRPEFQYH